MTRLSVRLATVTARRRSPIASPSNCATIAARSRLDHLALVGSDARRKSHARRRAAPRDAQRRFDRDGKRAQHRCATCAPGCCGLTLAQAAFLARGARTYAVAVAVGDVYALVMALRARARRRSFVGTAKSVSVAPYGRSRRAVCSGARAACFVRDGATARALREHGVQRRAAQT